MEQVRDKEEAADLLRSYKSIWRYDKEPGHMSNRFVRIRRFTATEFEYHNGYEARLVSLSEVLKMVESVSWFHNGKSGLPTRSRPDPVKPENKSYPW